MNSLILNLLSSTGCANKQNKVKVNDNQTCSKKLPIMPCGLFEIMQKHIIARFSTENKPLSYITDAHKALLLYNL